MLIKMVDEKVKLPYRLDWGYKEYWFNPVCNIEDEGFLEFLLHRERMGMFAVAAPGLEKEDLAPEAPTPQAQAYPGKRRGPKKKDRI